MMRVLSPIYPPEIKPVREGWYLTQVPGTLLWQSRWWGGRWYASDAHHFPLADRAWQGLAFNPAGAFEYDVSPGMSRIHGVFVPGASCSP